MTQRSDDSTPRYRAGTRSGRTAYERIENAEAPLVPRAPTGDDSLPAEAPGDRLLGEGAE